MKNLTLTNLRNAETLEAITLLNYYACRFNKLEEQSANALTALSQTKSILELLGLYSDFTITRSIEIYTSLSAEDIEAFRYIVEQLKSRGYKFIDIAKKLNMDRSTVYRLCHNYFVKSRVNAEKP